MEIACKSFNYSPTRAICELNNATLSGAETELPQDDKNSKYFSDFNFYKESGLIFVHADHDHDEI